MFLCWFQSYNGFPHNCPSAVNASGGQPATSIGFLASSKYIVLSKYYQNIYGLNVGDQITLNVNEKDEQYEILKFVNHVYKKIVIVNQSESLYYGYIIDNVNLNDIVMQEFESYPYNIINLQDKMVAYQHIVLSTINVVTILLTSIIILIILFSIYLSYQEYVYNYTNLKKLKLIGYSNKLMFKVSLTKLVYNIVVIILLALFSGFYILSNIDKLMSLLNTIMYIEFDIKLLSISLLISISALLIGYVYSIIKYFKIKWLH